MNDLSALIENVRKARVVRDAIDGEMGRAVQAARLEVEKSYKDRRATAARALSIAEKSLDDVKIANARYDPMVGKRVSRLEQKGSIISGRGVVARTFGIVEVMTNATTILANSRSKPVVGQLFVRLERNDGTIGVKIASYGPSWQEVK